MKSTKRKVATEAAEANRRAGQWAVFQALEGRRMFATSSLSAGVLTVTGTGGDDIVTITDDGLGNLVVDDTVTQVSYATGSVTQINMNGLGGSSDSLTVNASINALITTAATGGSVLTGGDGNDTITGGAGDDTIDGGLGNDSINGGAGNDQITGNGGNDTLTGGAGTNVVAGGNGDDSLTSSGAGDDLSGGVGDDTIQAANGVADITIDGGPGTDDGFLDAIDPVPISIENLTGGPTPELDVTYSTKRGPRGIRSGNSIDFGTGDTAHPTVTRILTLTNGGTSDLALGGITVPTGFTVIDGVDVAFLAPGESETVVIGRSNAVAGTRAGTVTIDSSDANTPFTIDVIGTITLPPQPAQLQVIAYRGKGRTAGVTNGTTAEYGTVFLSKLGTVARTFKFTNTGGTTLDLGRMSLPKGYVATDPLVRTLAPGQSDFLTISLDTRVAGVRVGPVSFSIVGDSTSDIFLLNLSGIVKNPYGAS